MKKPSKSFEHLLHPYVFLFQAGEKIEHDFLNYSLLLLQVGQPDVVHSPYPGFKPSTPFIQLLKR
jgi:hypothetical protein